MSNLDGHQYPSLREMKGKMPFYPFFSLSQTTVQGQKIAAKEGLKLFEQTR